MLIKPLLQTLLQLPGPSLQPVQELSVCLVVRSLQLSTVLQVAGWQEQGQRGWCPAQLAWGCSMPGARMTRNKGAQPQVVSSCPCTAEPTAGTMPSSACPHLSPAVWQSGKVVLFVERPWGPSPSLQPQQWQLCQPYHVSSQVVKHLGHHGTAGGCNVPSLRAWGAASALSLGLHSGVHGEHICLQSLVTATHPCWQTSFPLERSQQESRQAAPGRGLHATSLQDMWSASHRSISEPASSLLPRAAGTKAA